MRDSQGPGWNCCEYNIIVSEGGGVAWCKRSQNGVCGSSLEGRSQVFQFIGYIYNDGCAAVFIETPSRTSILLGNGNFHARGHQTLGLNLSEHCKHPIRRPRGWD
jgi:hypothetical protein